jgi:RNase adaptor protein for sRNA GlmZ degradation
MTTPRLLVVSFGYGHNEQPTADVTVDVRDWFRDPHIDPAMRAMTGLDPRVHLKVVDTPGVHDLIQATLGVAEVLLNLDTHSVTVAFGCVGGRHRSVVLANELAARAFTAGWHPVEVSHLHVERPVLDTTRGSGGSVR